MAEDCMVADVDVPEIDVYPVQTDEEEELDEPLLDQADQELPEIEEHQPAPGTACEIKKNLTLKIAPNKRNTQM